MYKSLAFIVVTRESLLKIDGVHYVICDRVRHAPFVTFGLSLLNLRSFKPSSIPENFISKLSFISAAESISLPVKVISFIVSRWSLCSYRKFESVIIAQNSRNTRKRIKHRKHSVFYDTYQIKRFFHVGSDLSIIFEKIQTCRRTRALIIVLTTFRGWIICSLLCIDSVLPADYLRRKTHTWPSFETSKKSNDKGKFPNSTTRSKIG